MIADNSGHPESFGNVVAKYDELKKSFEPAYFSKTMCESIKEQQDIKDVITKLVRYDLTDNKAMQDIIKSIIDEHFKHSGVQDMIKGIMDKHFVYKIGLWLPAIVSGVLSFLMFILNYYSKP